MTTDDADFTDIFQNRSEALSEDRESVLRTAFLNQEFGGFRICETRVIRVQ